MQFNELAARYGSDFTSDFIRGKKNVLSYDNVRATAPAFTTTYLHNVSLNVFSYYAYDNIKVVLSLVDKFIQLYGDYDQVSGAFILDEHAATFSGISSCNATTTQSNNNNTFKNLFVRLLSEIYFVGMTGEVSFDGNGDRRDAMITYCNVLADGTIASIGFFRSGGTGNSSFIKPINGLIFDFYFIYVSDARVCVYDGGSPLTHRTHHANRRSGMAIDFLCFQFTAVVLRSLPRRCIRFASDLLVIRIAIGFIDIRLHVFLNLVSQSENH